MSLFLHAIFFWELIMPSIYQAQCRFWMPLEAQSTAARLLFLQACNGCPISLAEVPPDPTIYLTYCGAPLDIVDTMTFSELNASEDDAVELNNEATSPWCDGHLEGPVIDPETLLPTIIVDEHAITTSAPVGATGACLYTDFGDGPVMLGVGVFPAPLGAGETGDIFKISGRLMFCPCTPATE